MAIANSSFFEYLNELLHQTGDFDMLRTHEGAKDVRFIQENSGVDGIPVPKLAQPMQRSRESYQVNS